MSETPLSELPGDLTASEYRRLARDYVHRAADCLHGPQADRLVASAQVYATCALSAPPAPPTEGVSE